MLNLVSENLHLASYGGRKCSIFSVKTFILQAMKVLSICHFNSKCSQEVFNSF
eukprot:c33201_g1_i1 orf=1-156(-)